ncbi:putative membrane protein [Pseudonocardia eucalypti]|uniref:SRPBCC family protein n=1 Tax=Pseudonocardia eucalypti TaxID=648755 RepID=UPI00161E8CDC|nr:putative membrane protein [Pseudonocardia eucalypti]
MEYRVAVEINAAPDRVWAVLEDVARWPAWSPTMDSVELLTDGPFGRGSKAEVRQPKLAKAVWTVTAFEPGRRFEWSTSSVGVTTRADHVIVPTAAGCQVTLEIAQTGALAGLIGLAFGSLTRRYVDLEGASLKKHCESSGAS